MVIGKIIIKFGLTYFQRIQLKLFNALITFKLINKYEIYKTIHLPSGISKDNVISEKINGYTIS